jgi:hypothetical protein
MSLKRSEYWPFPGLLARLARVRLARVIAANRTGRTTDVRRLAGVLACARAASGHTGRSAAEKRDEVAPFQLKDWHFAPTGQGRTAYRIGDDRVRASLRCGISLWPWSGGQKPRPSQPHHVSFRRQRTLGRASIRWSSRPTLLR